MSYASTGYGAADFDEARRTTIEFDPRWLCKLAKGSADGLSIIGVAFISWPEFVKGKGPWASDPSIVSIAPDWQLTVSRRGKPAVRESGRWAAGRTHDRTVGPA
jgi:hypothetical protein